MKDYKDNGGCIGGKIVLLDFCDLTNVMLPDLK